MAFAWANPLVYEPKPLTAAMIEEAAQRLREQLGGPDIEYHHLKCPKILTQCRKACRCGASPLEAIFEDDMKETA